MEPNSKLLLWDFFNDNPAILIALIAFVSPIVTALINNSHQIKIREMELKAETNRNTVFREIQILEDALSGLGKYSSNYTVRATSVFPESLSSLLKAYPYISDPKAAEAIILTCGLDSSNRDELNNRISLISAAIKDELNKRNTIAR